MENWKRWFQPRILERGREYFDEGRVQTVEHSGDGYSAVVRGSEDYEVEILLEGDSIQEMFCNCRYAEDWNYCKHMAAVLFAVTAGKAVPKKRVSQNTRITPETLAAKIPDDQLRPLLAELMRADEKLYREMLLQYGGAGPDECARMLRKTLTGIKKRYADRGGYINYHDVKGYTAEIADFIKRQAATLITQNAPFLAFQLGLEAVQEYDRCGVDDSEGWSAMVTEAMEHLREQVLSAADEESASKIFDLLAGSYRPDRFDGLVRDFVEETLFSYFQDETSERKKLALADQWIATLEKTAGENYSSEFEIQGLLVRRYDIMKELSMPEEERNAFLERYLNFSAVRKLYVQHMLDTGRPEEAARLLEEGKSVNQDRPGLVADYSERLIDVYAQLGWRDRLLAELEYHVLTLGSGGLEMLNRLKNACTPEQWLEYRERYLSGRHRCKLELMESEGLWERLMDAVTASNSLYLLNRYEEVLKKQYPSEIMETYIRILEEQAEQVSNREQYRELAGYLKKLKSYPGGAARTGELADSWRTRYGRRRAMMEELGKAGF